MTLDIVMGWDTRQPLGYSLFQFSALRRSTRPIRFIPLVESSLRYGRLYNREHEVKRGGQLWDVISDAPMATSFANSRFLTLWLARHQTTLFCDGADMLFMADPAALFALADDRYAIQVVKHRQEPTEATKMDGQKQTAYSRKNWSSLILWNPRHPSNRRLTLDMINNLPGRDLHRFCWLEDDEIGELPSYWNFLVGVQPYDIGEPMPSKVGLLHYTLGTPELIGRDGSPFQDRWLDELAEFGLPHEAIE